MRSLPILKITFIIFFASFAVANQNKVEINSPLDGAKIKAQKKIDLTYDLTLGSGADHAHAYTDGKEVAILKKMKGSYSLAPVTPGKHEICVRLVNKNHTPIGVDRCINVVAE